MVALLSIKYWTSSRITWFFLCILERILYFQGPKYVLLKLISCTSQRIYRIRFLYFSYMKSILTGICFFALLSKHNFSDLRKWRICVLTP
jgi:hypothetical protein